MTSALQAEFLEGSRGKILAVVRRPAAASSGSAVLIAPPLGDEMNKCRRMFAETARMLAARGVATVIPDLYGTGDSAGEFVEADCDIWLDDLRRVCAWSAERNWRVRAILGVRLGCVLGARLAKALQPAGATAVFWQPVVDGERFLNQLLRMRVAASMMEADRRESIGDLRKVLTDGGVVEVSGYELGSRLAAQVDRLKLAEEAGVHLPAIHWMELVRDADASLPAPSTRCIEQLQAAGSRVQIHTAPGEPYWSSTEIVCNDAIVAATVQVLSEPDRAYS